MSISLTSPAFKPESSIPPEHTADGQDRSPPLEWSGVPDGARELAIVCEDPDAPSKTPWVHWVVYGVPAETASLGAGVEPVAKPAALQSGVQGQNSWNSVGYRGPAPPKGDSAHHYHFTLYALDQPLGLGPEADKQTLMRAMDGHVLAKGELVGTYSR